tara:strand:+ start:679 stop:1941 length:1263 start_codon:yes stop_codon:yes gene_type:complete
MSEVYIIKKTKKYINILFFNRKYSIYIISSILVTFAGFLIASTQREASYADWYNHWITAGIGYLIAFIFSLIPLSKIRKLLVPIYLLTIGSLIAVQMIGTSALGSQRWLSVGGFNIQPSEFAKISVILFLASVLEKKNLTSPKSLIKPLLLICIPWLLVFLQPDLGTSLVFGAFLSIMLYWAGMPVEWLIIIFSTLITALLASLAPLVLFFWIPFMGFLANKSIRQRKLATGATILLHTATAFLTPWLWMNGLQDYQRDRLILFLDPTKDPLGGGYHLLQSTVGIGSGGWFGSGLLQGQLTKLRFIPEQHTDFIFSALGEEMGFVGILLVVGCFFALIINLLGVARDARTDFESLAVIGIVTMILFQVIVNIFMTIGLGPITGIPLPFMSYGRSALLVNFISLGICLSVANRAYTNNNFR